MYTRVTARLRMLGSTLNNVADRCQTPVVEEVINPSLHGLAVNMARHCTHVQYFPEPKHIARSALILAWGES